MADPADEPSAPSFLSADPQPTLLLADVALDLPPTAGGGVFTYAVPPELATDIVVGACVLVPLRGGRQRGFVVAVEQRPLPTFKVRPILEIRVGVRLPPALMRLIAWGAHYYRFSLRPSVWSAGWSPQPPSIRRP